MVCGAGSQAIYYVAGLFVGEEGEGGVRERERKRVKGEEMELFFVKGREGGGG